MGESDDEKEKKKASAAAAADRPPAAAADEAPQAMEVDGKEEEGGSAATPAGSAKDERGGGRGGSGDEKDEADDGDIHMCLSPSAKELHHHHRYNKYVKPRIGYQFQVRVPKASASVSRSSSQQSLTEGDDDGGGGAAATGGGTQQSDGVGEGRPARMGRRPSSSSSTGGAGGGASGSRGEPSGRGRGGGKGPKGGLQDAPMRQNSEAAGGRAGASGPAPVPSSARAPLSTYAQHQQQLRADLPPAPKGGLCIHRPTTANGTDDAATGGEGVNAHFLRFARNIILETPRWNSVAALAETDWLWTTEVEAKFRGGFGGGGGGGGGSSGGNGGGGNGGGNGGNGGGGSGGGIKEKIDGRTKRGRKRKLQLAAEAAAAAGNDGVGAGDADSVAGGSVSGGRMSPKCDRDTDDDARSVSPKPPAQAGSTSGQDDDAASSAAGSVAGGGTIPSAAAAPPPLSAAAMKEDATFLENDEQVLAYLHGRHGGDADVSKLSMLSHLSMGKAVQARRYMKKMRKQEEVETPLSDMLYPSEVWRRRYERLCNTVTGDNRRRPGIATYPFGLHTEDEGNASAPPPGISAGLDVGMHSGRGSSKSDYYEELKRPWRSVLDCAEAIVERTSNDQAAIDDSRPSKPRPRLRDLLILLRKAHTLLRPEEVFGKRDTAVKRISQCMNAIVDLVVTARNRLATLNDVVFDEDCEGIELDALASTLDDIDGKSPIVLEEVATMRGMVDKALQWEARLNRVLKGDFPDSSSCLTDYKDRTDILSAADRMVVEANDLSLRPRSLVLVKKRVDRAKVLRDRLREMSMEKSETMKQYTSLVREANRIDLAFPEVTMLSTVHQAAEEWSDRATIAIRSRISLAELEDLVDRGDDMPVNLSDLLEKLRSRVEQARRWIGCLKEVVPGSSDLVNSGDEKFAKDRLKWLMQIRRALNDETDSRSAELLELAQEGSRIPVDMEELQLLQIEVDARNWTVKAKKWSDKKGKIEELREHLTRGEAISDKVQLSAEEKEHWTLVAEADLEAVVRAADKWHRKYRSYIEGDNRRSGGRSCVSLPLLRQIVDEANDIPANLGNAATKMARILGQAESWYDQHKSLLSRCGVHATKDAASTSSPPNNHEPVKLETLSDAVESASEVSIDLEEALQLQKILDKAQDWFDRAQAVAPKRTKRTAKGKKKSSRLEKHSLEELLALVEEASGLLVDTTEDLERLNIQLNDVQSWRLQAQCVLKDITGAFIDLRKERTSFCGAPEKFLQHLVKETKETVEDDPKEEEQQQEEKEKEPESGKEQDQEMDPNEGSPGKAKSSDNVSAHKMVASFLRNAQNIGIYTVEEEIAELIERVSKWLTKAASTIASPDKVFEKRYFREFDNFIVEGESLLSVAEKPELSEESQLDEPSLLSNLNASWAALISDEKVRLENLRDRRDDFIAWCEKIQEFLSETEKKMPLESLRELLGEGSMYPKAGDVAKKLHQIVTEANTWAESTKKLLEAEGTITMDEAKEAIDKGDELNITCQEYRTLRNALRMVRGWALRVKRSNAEHGQAHISDIKELIAEHETFLVSMPDEVEILKQAMCGYCLCRKPYDGFMVGCDTCEEWYHGPCVGVSESQAERYDKYVCVRCCTSKQYKTCADLVLSTIRKWTMPKDLVKSRQIDNQRHQRKIREKKREIEKLKVTVEKVTKELRTHGWEAKQDSINSKKAGKGVGMGAGGSGKPVKSEGSESGSTPIPSDAKVNEVVKNEIASSAEVGKGTDVKNEEAAHLGTSEQAPAVATASKDTAPKTESDSTTQKNASLPPIVKGLREKLSKAEETLENCNRRMERLCEITLERKALEHRENVHKVSLRIWCIMVRSSVLIPSTEDEALRSRPPSDGNLSSPMVAMVQEAKKFGIAELADVAAVINAFGCLSWGLRALTALAKKSKIEEIQSIVALNDYGSFKLPEEKCVRMLKSILSRASLWQAKVRRTLRPIPGETRPYEKSYLEKLQTGTKDVPFIMPEESWLLNTIEDKGARHCICGGPSDGSFMISCDKCEKWFHAKCVKYKESANDQSRWMCPPCKASAPTENGSAEPSGERTSERNAAGNDAVKDQRDDWEEEFSPHAPNPNTLWPPFGLLHSSTALTALGVSNVSQVPVLSIKKDEKAVVTAPGTQLMARNVVAAPPNNGPPGTQANPQLVKIKMMATNVVTAPRNNAPPGTQADSHLVKAKMMATNVVTTPPNIAPPGTQADSQLVKINKMATNVVTAPPNNGPSEASIEQAATRQEGRRQGPPNNGPPPSNNGPSEPAPAKADQADTKQKVLKQGTQLQLNSSSNIVSAGTPAGASNEQGVEKAAANPGGGVALPGNESNVKDKPTSEGTMSTMDAMDVCVNTAVVGSSHEGRDAMDICVSVTAGTLCNEAPSKTQDAMDVTAESVTKPEDAMDIDGAPTHARGATPNTQPQPPVQPPVQLSVQPPVETPVQPPAQPPVQPPVPPHIPRVDLI